MLNENDVKNATPAELTLMLFDGCLQFIDQGKTFLQQKDYESANYYIQRAERIVNEFRATLDHQYEISKQLDPLYVYVYNKLITGNIRSNIDDLNEASNILTELRNAWYQIINQ